MLLSALHSSTFANNDSLTDAPKQCSTFIHSIDALLMDCLLNIQCNIIIRKPYIHINVFDVYLKDLVVLLTSAPKQ